MRRQPKHSFRFWLISAIVHGSLFVILVLSPPGRRIFEREARTIKPEIIREDEALSEVIEDIRDLAVLRLKGQVALLEAGRERMATNFDTMNRYFQPFVSDQIRTARERLEEIGKKTLTLQQELFDAIQRAVEQKEHGSDPMWRAYDERRATIVAGQDDIRRALLLGAPDDAALIDLQNQAEEKQMEVFALISSSVSAQNNLWAIPKDLEKLQTRISAADETITKTEARLATLPAEIAELEEKLREVAEEQKSADAALKSAEDTVEEKRGNRSEYDKAREVMDRARREKKKLDDRARHLAERLKDRNSSLKRLQGKLEKTRKSLAGAKMDVKQLESRKPETEKERDSNAGRAASLQQEVLEIQNKVFEQLLVNLKDVEAGVPSPEDKEKPARAPVAPTPTGGPAQ